MPITCPTPQSQRLLVSRDSMRTAERLNKYWITACDAQRRVIFNKVITASSAAEARIIAESCVPAEHHGSICITDESDNSAIDGDTSLPQLSARSVILGAAPRILLAAEAPCA